MCVYTFGLSLLKHFILYSIWKYDFCNNLICFSFRENRTFLAGVQSDRSERWEKISESKSKTIKSEKRKLATHHLHHREKKVHFQHLSISISNYFSLSSLSFFLCLCICFFFSVCLSISLSTVHTHTNICFEIIGHNRTTTSSVLLQIMSKLQQSKFDALGKTARDEHMGTTNKYDNLRKFLFKN